MNMDFGRRHWLMMIVMSLVAIALMFGVGFLLEWLTTSYA
jgi:hypothetical protein